VITKISPKSVIIILLAMLLFNNTSKV